MKLCNTFAIAAGACLLTFSPAIAQTSSGTSASADTSGSMSSGQPMSKDAAGKMTCEEFLVLDTPDQGMVLMPLMPSHASASSSGMASSGGTSAATDTTAATGSTAATDTTAATGSTAATDATAATDTTAATGTTAATDTTAATGTAPAASGTDTTASTATTTGGTGGMAAGGKNDKHMVAVVTGVFEACASTPTSTMGDAATKADEGAKSKM